MFDLYVPTAPPKVLAALGAAILLYITLTALYNVYLHPLRRFPGPWLWRAYRWPYVVSMQRGELHQRMKEYHEKYGTIVRLAPNELSFIDPNAWGDVYGNRPGHSVFERNRTWLRKMRPGDPISIMDPDEEAHRILRKTFVQAFSEKALKDQAPVVEGYVDLLISHFRERISKEHRRSNVDLVTWLDFLFFDISGDLSFGVSFDCLKSGKAHPWVEICHSFGKGLAMISSIGFYSPLDKLLQYIIPKKARQKMLDHRAMTKERVHQRLAMETERPDFITALIKNNEEKGNTMTTGEWEMNMSVLIFAGSETTASGVSGIMRMLLQNPKSLSILVKEIRGAFDQEQDIRVASVNRLEYLNAVINEGLRLCPPVVVGVPRVSPPGGETICSKFIAEGTYVALNQYPAFRSSTNFNRPSEFIPERFVRSADTASADDMSVFLPFQTGRHSCIGQRLAMAEMRLVLARLLFAFDISLADPQDVWDWGDQSTWIFWEKRPLNVVIEAAR